MCHAERNPPTMPKTVEYQGYTLQSAPRRLGNAEKWGLHVVISVDDGRRIRTREFSTSAVYVTEQDAEIDGMAFGQRIIDGKVYGYSVTDLRSSNRRAMPRLRVQFRAAFSDTT